MSNTNNYENQLHLDTESVQERNGSTYASLTDAYGIPVFTDAYKAEAEQYKEGLQGDIEQITGNIFSNKAMKNQQQENEIHELLFADKSETAIQVSSTASKIGIKEYEIAGVTLAVLLLVLAVGYRFRHKKV